ALSGNGMALTYVYDIDEDETAIVGLLQDLADAGIAFTDLHTTQRSLEDIFVGLVTDHPREPR
ncbi:MAG: multidrug ABC transporter ATP-binding protein, partial [Betaproteobacteria bacterium HGW-Betaproteobacteria-21]